MACTKFKRSSGSISVNFYNDTCGTINIGTFNSEDEADDAINKYETEFYRDNSNLLPKGVSVQYGVFVLSVRSHTLSKGDHYVRIASARTIKEIKELRTKSIASLLDVY